MLPRKPPATPMARLLHMLGCCIRVLIGCDGDVVWREADGEVEDWLGELYDREPRLPDDVPPPTLANTSSSVIHMKKNRNVKKVIPIFDHFPENISISSLW
jgi:hypothetical protein